MESKRRVISLLVDNQSGVLARVSNLFCRRGFNIDSLTVSATNDPAVSRITVTITSDEKALQPAHPADRAAGSDPAGVRAGPAKNRWNGSCCCSRWHADVHNRSELREIASIYKAKIIDLSPGQHGVGADRPAGQAGRVPENVRRITTSLSSAAPALPHWSAAGCTSISRSRRRRCAPSSCPRRAQDGHKSHCFSAQGERKIEQSIQDRKINQPEKVKGE